MAGYEWQHFWRKDKSRAIQYYPSTNSKAGQIYYDSGKDYNKDGVLEDYVYPTENYLVSFFGRANWSLMDGRYMVTATVRNDGSHVSRSIGQRSHHSLSHGVSMKRTFSSRLTGCQT